MRVVGSYHSTAEQQRMSGVGAGSKLQRVDGAVRALSFVAIAFCLCLAGCTRAQLMKRITPREDESFARRYVELLRQQAFDQVEHVLDPSIAGSDVRNKLATMVGLFPSGDPKSTKVVAFSFRPGRESSTHWLTLEYEFPDKWLLVAISIQRKGGASTIAGLSVTPLADSLEHVNRFSLVGKSALQYAVLGLALVAAIFSFYVFVVCLRTKRQNRKWLWAIFILAGVGKLGVNWTTGALQFTPLAINIPCAGGSAMTVYGPWVVSVYAPLGAIVYLMKRRKHATPNEVEPSPPEQLPPTLPE
jgi:hypothetical protein